MKPAFFKTAIIILAPLLLNQSCIEEFSADLPDDETDLLVIEGAIVSDDISTFYLSRSVPLTGEPVSTPINARLTITGSDGINIDVKPEHEGSNIYSAAVPKLNPEAEYKLTIECDGETYVSNPQKPYPQTPIEKVEFNQPGPFSSVNILITPAPPANSSETQYFRWLYNETWEVRAKYKSDIQWNPDKMEPEPLAEPYTGRGWCLETSHDFIASSSAYYNDNQIKGYRLYSINRMDKRLSTLYSTEIVQRSISKEEYEYENERRRISQGMGGLFTPQPSVLPSNIHCTTSTHHVIGYIGCSLGSARYRIFIGADDVNTDIPDHCRAYYSYQENFPGNTAMYKDGYRLFYYSQMPGSPPDTGWTTFECLDVTRASDTTVMPSYWPE